MKQIIILHPHFTIYGGAGQFVLEVGKRLSKKGYKVIVVSIKADEEIISAYKKYISFIDINGPLSSSILFWITFPLSYLKIVKILNNYEKYILFPQVFPSNWWGFIYKFFHPKVKLVWMCQEPSAFIHSKNWINSIESIHIRILAKVLRPILSFFDTKLAKKSDYIFANSNFTKKSAINTYKFNSKKIKTLYLGIDPQKFKNSRKFKKQQQILSVCRLTKFKNIETIIGAMKILKGKGIKVKLFIVGNGENKRNLMNLVLKNKLAREIVFKGEVSTESLIDLYKKSKILISASVDEPFGLSILESMACGTPVIAVNSGGPSEIVIDGKTGYLIPGKRPDILAQKISFLLEKNYLFEMMSKKCILHLRDFSWDITVNKICSEFARLEK